MVASERISILPNAAGRDFVAGSLRIPATGDTEVKPIPGSITYNGQPRTKLTKSPPGSVLQNSFYDSSGTKVLETYILQPDRTLKLTRRELIADVPQ